MNFAAIIVCLLPTDSHEYPTSLACAAYSRQLRGIQKNNMKNLRIASNVSVLLILSLTTNNFRNDFINLFDWTVFSLIVIDNIIIRYFNVKRVGVICNYLSIVQIIYCISTVSSNDEIEFTNIRILDLFSSSLKTSSTMLSLIELIWLSTIISIIVMQVYLFLVCIKLKMFNASARPSL